MNNKTKNGMQTIPSMWKLSIHGSNQMICSNKQKRINNKTGIEKTSINQNLVKLLPTMLALEQHFDKLFVDFKQVLIRLFIKWSLG